MAYTIGFLSLAFFIFISIRLIEKIKNKYSEDNQHSIYIELNLRRLGKTKENPLSKYSEQELEVFIDQLRGIAIKKKLGYKLNKDERALVKRFPNSFSIARIRQKAYHQRKKQRNKW